MLIYLRNKHYTYFIIFTFVFQGSKNYISQNWSWTSDYICNFEYEWYPFDTQCCHIEDKILGSNITIRAINVVYTGSSDLGKYYFRQMSHCSVDKIGRSGLTLDFIISRPLTSNSLTLFLPTAMLLLISQMSTTFSDNYLEMVIEVNATLLLVLTTQQVMQVIVFPKTFYVLQFHGDLPISADDWIYQDD